MAKKKDFYSEVFTEWCRMALPAIPREYCSFDLLGDPPREIERKIERANRFEEKLDELCRRFNFKVQKARLEHYAGVAEDLSLADCDTGDLDRSVAEYLVFAFQRSKEARKSLKVDLSISKSARRKRGAERSPAFFAEAVLVGIELHNKSDEALTWFRKFLSPNGGLQKYLRRPNVLFGDDADSAFICKMDKGLSLRVWKDQTKQKYARIVLSHELGVDVKGFKKHQRELNQLKMRVADRAAEISEKVRSKLSNLSPS